MVKSAATSNKSKTTKCLCRNQTGRGSNKWRRVIRCDDCDAELASISWIVDTKLLRQMVENLGPREPKASKKDPQSTTDLQSKSTSSEGDEKKSVSSSNDATTKASDEASDHVLLVKVMAMSSREHRESVRRAIDEANAMFKPNGSDDVGA